MTKTTYESPVSVGDEVWMVDCEYEGELLVCPLCKGEEILEIKDGRKIECSECEGFGHISNTYKVESVNPIPLPVRELRLAVYGEKGEKLSWFITDHDDLEWCLGEEVFPTKEEAEAYCERESKNE